MNHLRPREESRPQIGQAVPHSAAHEIVDQDQTPSRLRHVAQQLHRLLRIEMVQEERTDENIIPSGDRRGERVEDEESNLCPRTFRSCSRVGHGGGTPVTPVELKGEPGTSGPLPEGNGEISGSGGKVKDTQRTGGVARERLNR